MDYYCADHYGYVTGKEAREFILKTIQVAKKNRTQMEVAFLSVRDIDIAAQKLISSFYGKNPYYFLSPEIYLDIYRQMVRHVATVMKGKV